jgi:signal transduction histidine kinase
MSSETFGFTVDTHLFRELGELLVGRDSTALIELVKNSYDADATVVTLDGLDLLKPTGQIIVSDDGIGMTPSIFSAAFLRIAGRYKEQGGRTSPRYHRRYTGAKGVGRLSAHKLAETLDVRSVPALQLYNENAKSESRQGVDATIGWREVEDEHSTLDDVGDGLRVRSFAISDERAGTTLTLRELKGNWTKRSLAKFVREVAACVPPAELMRTPTALPDDSQSMLGQLTPWTRGEDDPGFKILFRGDLNVGDDLWMQLFGRSNWLLEIHAAADSVRFDIFPTATTLKVYPHARAYHLRRDHPKPSVGPFFTARIYAREGQVGGTRASELARFADENSGIRVYLEGFRVVPYGERHDDWLGLNQDYARRVRELDIILDDTSSAELPEQEGESYRIAGNYQYTGGVFMTADDAASLRPVVNREGFLQDEAFNHLRELVRNGVDLLTRARAATRAGSRTNSATDLRKKVDGETPESANSKTHPSPAPLSDDAEAKPTSNDNLNYSLTRVRSELSELKLAVTADPILTERIDKVAAAAELAQQSASQEHADQAMLEILASVGLQFSAFIHEVNGLLSEAQAVRTLAAALDTKGMEPSQRGLVKDIRAGIESLCLTLTRQASYLTEVVGPDARRRRRRIPLSSIARTSLLLLTSSIEDRNISIQQDLPSMIRTPPIFPAEMTIICTNLLTNAIKAAGSGGNILMSGKQASAGGINLRIENTGTAVSLGEAERWFQPFETTTTDVDIILGQGMGLGLPITRRIVSEYGGAVRFVEPSSGYSTAVEVTLPGKELGS